MRSKWRQMHKRCTDPKHCSWTWYGAKGVTVCQEWNSFEQFLADMGLPPLSTTLDRIDPFLGYSKANCRWATLKEQASNTRAAYRNRRGWKNVFRYLEQGVGRAPRHGLYTKPL
jgi:hypothetical protein